MNPSNKEQKSAVLAWPGHQVTPKARYKSQTIIWKGKRDELNLGEFEDFLEVGFDFGFVTASGYSKFTNQ
jgi:hypothetical protein